MNVELLTMLLSVSSVRPWTFCPLTHLLSFTFSDAFCGSARNVADPFRRTPTSANVIAPILNDPWTHVSLVAMSGFESTAIAAASNVSSISGMIAGS